MEKYYVGILMFLFIAGLFSHKYLKKYLPAKVLLGLQIVVGVMMVLSFGLSVFTVFMG
jgi:hypothetical protein